MNTKEGEKGWVQSHMLSDYSYGGLYLTSLHWAYSQLHGNHDVSPGTGAERLFGIFVLFIELVVSTLFLCTIMTSMIEFKQLQFDDVKNYRMLKLYLWEAGVSRRLRFRIERFARQIHNTARTRSNQVEFLQWLPECLARELEEELRMPAFASHPLLKCWETSPISKALCHETIRNVSLQTGEILFSTLGAGCGLYIVERGWVIYGRTLEKELVQEWVSLAPDQGDGWHAPDWLEEMRVIREKQALCEAALWTRWVHCGSAASGSHGGVWCVEGQAFANVVSSYPNQAIQAMRHAVQFTRFLNSLEAREVSDVVSLPETEQPR